jgi:hypothetical protein
MHAARLLFDPEHAKGPGETSVCVYVVLPALQPPLIGVL